MTDRRERLAYAAGLIDGEGCIGIYKNSHNGNYQLRICVEMVEEGGIAELFHLFGGRFYFKGHKPPKRPTHIWMVFNSAAEAALKEILPFLKVKTRQASTALMANWSWQTKAAGRFFNTISPSEQATRVICHTKMKSLNRRGCNGDERKQSKGPIGDQKGTAVNGSSHRPDGSGIGDVRGGSQVRRI